MFVISMGELRSLEDIRKLGTWYCGNSRGGANGLKSAGELFFNEKSSDVKARS